MGSTRRRFTEEYKAHAVSLVIDGGRTNAEVAKSIGVHEMTLGKWVKKARDEGYEPGGSLSESERAELERLRKEIVQARMEGGTAGPIWPPSSTCIHEPSWAGLLTITCARPW